MITNKNDTLKDKTSSQEYFRSFYRGNHLLAAIILVISIAFNAIPLMLSICLGNLMDIAVNGSMSDFWKSCLMITALLILFFAHNTLWGRLQCRFLERAMRQYKETAFEKLTQKSISAFSRENTGRYLSVLTNDAANIEENYLSNSFSLVQNLVLFVATLCLLLWYSPLLTLLALVLCVLPLAVMLMMGNGLTRREQMLSQQNESFVASLQDLLKGFSVIKSFKAESHVQTLFSKENCTLEEIKFARNWYKKLLNAAAMSAALLMQCGVMLAAVILAMRGRITVGTVIIFVNCCNYLTQPIQIVPQYLASRKAAKGLVEKLAKITEENVREKGTAVTTEFREKIAFQNVSFGYSENKPAIENLSLEIFPGEKYALVGTSGSGKSTLLQLLMGAHDDYKGSITLDSREIKGINSDSLYDVMSLIGQDVYIFNDSIRNNITMYGDYPAQAVNTAIKQAGLSTLILERGESCLCGENGSGLSGGERQRISIARALLRGTPILLVDEATSSLDTETAHSVSEAILNLNTITSVTITHRLEESLLRQYDRIFVMKDGHLTEQGNYAELMDRKGLFYSLYTVANI